MNSKTFYWKELIHYWVNVEKRNGLSIPFILGASTVIDSTYKIEESSVGDLLNEIKNSDGDEIIVLEHCSDIGEYVLGLENPRNRKNGLVIKNEKTGRPKIIATISTEVLGKTFDEIVSSLSKKYLCYLHQGNFSRINLQWTKFSENDLKMINYILGDHRKRLIEI